MDFKIRQLAERPDFRRNPLVAIGKRLLWRARWAVRKDPWSLELDDGSRILAHSGGSAALIFYQKASEPETAGFLRAFLKPGMVFVDVGAHIGEYTLRAARIVGLTGEVHAFEPAPDNFKILKLNIKENGLTNAHANCAALSDSGGKLSFRIESDPALNRLQFSSDLDRAPHGIITVDSCRLDSYWASQTRAIDLIKLDVEGAELMVLKGAARLEHAPVWLFEYSPANYASFGYTPQQMLDAFQERGYRVWTWDGFSCKPVGDLSGRDVNLVAAPEGRHPLGPHH
jgi:FkbM family methyltransferase